MCDSKARKERPARRLKHRYEDIIKNYFKEIMWKMCALDLPV
jgi:hypothetical protein